MNTKHLWSRPSSFSHRLPLCARLKGGRDVIEDSNFSMSEVDKICNKNPCHREDQKNSGQVCFSIMKRGWYSYSLKKQKKNCLKKWEPASKQINDYRICKTENYSLYGNSYRYPRPREKKKFWNNYLHHHLLNKAKLIYLRSVTPVSKMFYPAYRSSI